MTTATATRQKQVVGITKVIGIPLQKESMTRTEKGSLIVTGFFTSDAKDMHGDIITREATGRAIEKYRQWGNIRLMHKPEPVGIMLGIGESDGLAWNQIKIEVLDENAAQMVEDGRLKALSIGAMIAWEDIQWLDDGGMYVTDYLLGEISLVDHPGNYDAALGSKDVMAAGDLKAMVKRYGFDHVAKSIMEYMKETEMAENANKDIVEETEVAAVEETPETVETEDAPVADESAEDAEATKDIADEAEDAEDAVVDDAEAIEETEEDTEDVAVEEDVEVSASVDGDGSMAQIQRQLAELTDAVKSLVETVNADKSVAETEVEEQETADDGGDEAADDGEIAEDAHKAVVPATDDEADMDTGTPEVRRSLNSALKTIFRVPEDK